MDDLPVLVGGGDVGDGGAGGEPRGGGTLQLPEGTLQLPGQAAAARGWTLPRVLIAINVACGLLILVGLLVLVFGGDPAPLAPEK